MQLGKLFKKAFGFDSPEEEEAELEGIDARVVPRRISSPQPPESADSGVTVVTDNSTVAETESGPDSQQSEPAQVSVPDSIFTTVVEVFDASLPDFMRQTVDGKAQREYLYERLSDDMKEYISNLETEADARCRARWESERVALQKQMETINEKIRKEEGERDDAKKQQLSAERQKRALNERVHDLEKQMAALEAENEQYILENKSLVNKLRITCLLYTSDAADEL